MGHIFTYLVWCHLDVLVSPFLLKVILYCIKRFKLRPKKAEERYSTQYGVSFLICAAMVRHIVYHVFEIVPIDVLQVRFV